MTSVSEFVSHGPAAQSAGGQFCWNSMSAVISDPFVLVIGAIAGAGSGNAHPFGLTQLEQGGQMAFTPLFVGG